MLIKQGKHMEFLMLVLLLVVRFSRSARLKTFCQAYGVNGGCPISLVLARFRRNYDFRFNHHLRQMVPTPADLRVLPGLLMLRCSAIWTRRPTTCSCHCAAQPAAAYSSSP